MFATVRTNDVCDSSVNNDAKVALITSVSVADLITMSNFLPANNADASIDTVPSNTGDPDKSAALFMYRRIVFVPIVPVNMPLQITRITLPVPTIEAGSNCVTETVFVVLEVAVPFVVRLRTCTEFDANA